MSEPTPATGNRPGRLHTAVMIAIWIVFVVKTARWWAGVSAGTTTVDLMTGWDWARAAFYHAAVTAAVVGLIGMLRERAGAGQTPDVPPGDATR